MSAPRVSSRAILASACVALLLSGCGRGGQEVDAVKAAVARYDELLRDGYQRQNMTFMREVASDEQALKLFNHMSALGEGNLRLSATLRDLQFVRVELPAPGESDVETREVWDFTHYRIATGERFAEEKGFVYRMAYALRKQEGRWVVTRADVTGSQAGDTTVPWPALDRAGNVRPGGPPGSGASTAPDAGH